VKGRGSDAQRLADLLEVGQALSSTLDLRSALGRVLALLETNHGVLGGTVVLLEPGSQELSVEAAAGVSSARARRARYKVGEGITGRVVASGRPITVPQVGREPLFLNRTGVWKGPGGPEQSYICVPLPLDGTTAGALGVSLPYRRDRDYDQETKFLSVVASMIGQSLRVRRLVEAERQRLLDENSRLRLELAGRYDLHNLVGRSRPMREVYEQVAQVAPVSTTVLIRGESGTGKELIAHAIHASSPRASQAYVKVNCAALPEALVESELFGHEAGAFTDARAAKQGRFDLAHGGTLFLDEVGELSPPTQVKLLRVLQERAFERLGGVKTVEVDVRVIAATNKDLELAVKAGTFREDLYYRLNVFAIYLPPLRDRRPDIPLLADHFVEKYAGQHGKVVRRLATSAIDLLMAYHWPGNVRELENCIERAVLVCEGGAIHAHHLPPTLQTAEVSGTVPPRSLEAAVGAYEKDLITDALKSARGNQARAARLLDTTERIVGYKIRKYGIDGERFKTGS
jgi:Nif-specific regulatory protein